MDKKEGEGEAKKQQVEDEQYAKFDSQHYAERYYCALEQADDWTKFVLWNLKSYLHEVSGARLLEVGSGPTLNVAIPASETFDEIVLSDFCQNNLDHIQLWLQRDPKAHDWSDVLRYFSDATLTVEQMAERVRSKVKKLVRCDVNTEQVLESPSGLFDLVACSLVIENACKTIEQSGEAVRRLSQLLKPKGYLLLVFATGQSFYSFNGVKYPSLPLSDADVVQLVQAVGLNVLKKAYLRTESNAELVGDDAEGMFVLLARKDTCQLR